MFGFHVGKITDNVSIAESINKAIHEAKEYHLRMNAVQIFVMGPRSYTSTLTKSDITSLAKLSQNGLKIIVHGTYFDSLNTAVKEDGAAARTIHFIQKELHMCDSIGAHGFILHLARCSPQDICTALLNIAGKDAKYPLECTKICRIFLEIEARKASALTYETVDKLFALFTLIKSHSNKFVNGIKFGLCVDTAHLFAAGVDIRGRDSAEIWLHDLRKMHEHCVRTGSSNVIISNFDEFMMVHLNDQEHEFGSGVDKHAPLFEGKMWSGYTNEQRAQSGAAAFCNLRNILICERHGNILPNEARAISALLNNEK